MNGKINYNVDDFGVLRVYRGNTILFEAQDFLSTPKKEIENFINENLKEKENKMRYFEVRKEVIDGTTRQYNVLIDGTHAGTSESEGEAREMTTGFSVWEYAEDGTAENVEFYPVATDMGDFTNNEDEVLEKIKADHPAGEWQNNEW